MGKSFGWLQSVGIDLIDCQVRTDHLVRFGAREIGRTDFLARLARAVGKPGRRGRWRMEEAPGQPAR